MHRPANIPSAPTPPRSPRIRHTIMGTLFAIFGLLLVVFLIVVRVSNRIEVLAALVRVDIYPTMKGAESLVVTFRLLADQFVAAASFSDEGQLDLAKQTASRFREEIEQLRTHSSGPEETADLEEIRTLFDSYYEKGSKLVQAMVGKNAVGSLDDLPGGLQSFSQDAQLLKAKLDLFLSKNETAFDSHMNQIDQGSQRVVHIVGALGVAIILFALALTYMASVAIVRPIEELSGALKEMAAGDLSRRVEVRRRDEVGILAESANRLAQSLQSSLESLVAGKNRLEEMMKTEKDAREALEAKVTEYIRFTEEIGRGDLTAALRTDQGGALGELDRHLNQMAGSLKAITTQVRDSTVSIAAAISQIVRATTQQSTLGAEQVTSISGISSIVEQILQHTAHTTSIASSVAASTKQVIDVSRKGEEAVAQSIDAMSRIRGQVELMAENILALSYQNQQIGEIMASVKDIAEQSNLLALNASIEAARAGDYGKGFAVVASEMGNLAEQSKQATAQVRTILNDVQKATNTAVIVTEQGSKEVNRGVHLVDQAGSVIRSLLATLSSAEQAAHKIVATVSEQAAGINHIAAAMKEIKLAAGDSQGSAEEVVNIAHDLSEQCSEMHDLVDKYRV